LDYDNKGLAYDRDLEESTLGILLVAPIHIKRVLSECKLRETSFFFDQNRLIFNAIVKLFHEGTPPDEQLVCSELDGSVAKHHVYDLAARCPAPSSVVHFANRLVELERWRDRRIAALKALEATSDRDLEKFSRARALLDDDEIRANSMSSPEQLGENFKKYMDTGETEAFALPYAKFNERMAGGLRRKQMTLIGGWSSHGKSVVMDQFLEHFSKQGFKCHLYINEMGEEDRVARSIARQTGIPYQRLLQHKISESERQSVEAVIADGCPYFAVSECAGWSIHELAYDIKSRSFDVIGIDILHLFDYESEIELARISRLLNRTAKQANCHVIATVHLNEYRVNDVVRPRPVTRDIRGSGMLKNDADNVMFIYREQDPETGDPLPPSSIYTSKVRNGQMGAVNLMFQEKTFSFKEEEY
jgi:replicative DNA helicase